MRVLISVRFSSIPLQRRGRLVAFGINRVAAIAGRVQFPRVPGVLSASESIRAMAGKPILTFGDMLRDLSDRRPTAASEPDEPDSPTTAKQKKIAHLRSMFYSCNPVSSTELAAAAPDRGRTQAEGQNLVTAFEKVSADLTAALSGDGNGDWVGLSEQLRALLSTAIQLITTALNETGPLVGQIRLLQALVERGRSALVNAQTSTA